MTSETFGSSYSAAYDLLYGEKDYRAEVVLIETALGRFGTGDEKSVLDFGCGTGGHALCLASDGYDVTGVDRSPAMLEVARSKAAEASTKGALHFVEGSVSSVVLGRKFDAVIMMFAVLGYQIENRDVRSSLRNVREHLKSNGIFIADFWYGPAVLAERPGERVRVVRDGRTQLIRTTSTGLDTSTHTADVKFDVWRLQEERLAERVSERHIMRYFFPKEIQLFMEVSGLRMESLSAFPSLDNPLTDVTWNALVIGRAV